MNMTSKQRMLTALDGGVPDRLPVTTHFIMPQFLEDCMGGISEEEFFDVSGWDPDHVHDAAPPRPEQPASITTRTRREPGFLESRRIASDQLARPFRAGFRAGSIRPRDSASSPPRAR